MDGWIFFFIRLSPLFFLPSTGVAPVPRLFSPPPPFMQIAYFVSPSPFFSRYGSLTWIEDGGRTRSDIEKIALFLSLPHPSPKTRLAKLHVLECKKGGKGLDKELLQSVAPPFPLFKSNLRVANLELEGIQSLLCNQKDRRGERETLFQREGLLASIRCDRNTFLSSVECRHLSFFYLSFKRQKEGETGGR